MKSDGHSLGLQVSRWPLALAHTQTPVSIGTRTRTHSRYEPSECLSWGQGTFECVLSQIVLKTKPGTNPSFEMNLTNCMLCLIKYTIYFFLLNWYQLAVLLFILQHTPAKVCLCWRNRLWFWLWLVKKKSLHRDSFGFWLADKGELTTVCPFCLLKFVS